MGDQIQQIEKVYDVLTKFLVEYSFQILGSLIVFLIGLLVAGKVAALILKVCDKRKVDVTLANFVANVVKILILTIVAVICLDKLGVTITPFVAALGAASLGAGLAIQGTLSNYSAGLTIIVSRPFVIKDTIRVQGVTGVVQNIKLAYTRLTDENGVEITIPNKHIVGEIIHNSFAHMLAEGCIGIAYDEDPEKTIKLISEAPKAVESASHEAPPQVGIKCFADSAIEIEYRYWLPAVDYYKLKHKINLDAFNALKDAGVKIPFPQREIRMIGDS